MRILDITKAVAATAAAVAAGLALAAAPAHADTQTHKDPRRDVTKIESPQRVVAPKPGIDIVSLKNSYKNEKLTMSITAAHLLRSGYIAEWYLVAGNSTYFVRFDHRAKKPTLAFFDTTPGPGTKQLSRGIASCLDARAAARGNSVIVAVPRFCIANTNSLRIAGLLTEQEPEGPATKIDESRSKGFKGELKFGPVLHRN